MSTRIAVLVSGGGTNLQALIDAQEAGKLGDGRITLVISSKPEVYALRRASEHGIPAIVVERKKYRVPDEYDEAMFEVLGRYHIDLIITAGFLSILGPKVLTAYDKKIINIHPALIPAFSGKGFYGLHVHKAVLDYGCKVTGATVHYVNGVVDGGEIILQKAVNVLDDDTPESLQKRVMEEAEWELLPKAVALLCGENADGDTEE